MARQCGWSSLVVGAVLAAGGPAFAEDTFRCANGTIFIGDTEGAVLQKCGAPSDAKRTEHQNRTRWGRIRDAVDIWTYDNGPAQFIRTLRFEGNVLRSIDVGGYGTRDKSER